MKKRAVFLLFLLISCSMYGQRKMEYNQKGDDAMKRHDYREAKMWYEEGVEFCDPYSINQLTSIWLSEDPMRISMRVVMNKCLSCLNERAAEKDTASMKKLITYYTEGIGTDKNESSANYWEQQLELFRNPLDINATNSLILEKKKLNYFFGYHFSLLAPLGIQGGVLGEPLGWYIRLGSNFTFQDYSKINTISGHINDIDRQDPLQFYRLKGENSVNSWYGTAGVMYQCHPSLYASVGVGYWSRQLMHRYELIDGDQLNVLSSGWTKNKDASYQGIKIDLAATAIVHKNIYGSVGGSLLSFKYLYFNVGVGLIF